MSEPLEMDPEIRGRWTAALRSGEISQATGKLRVGDGRCCLGVLCDLAVSDGIIPPPAERLDEWYYVARNDYLPRSVVEWARLSDSNPEVDTEGGMQPLGHLNDDDWSFAQIADAIEGVERQVTR